MKILIRIREIYGIIMMRIAFLFDCYDSGETLSFETHTREYEKTKIRIPERSFVMKQDVFETIEMEPGFFRIENGGVRCFFIEGDDRAMLVDTGFGNGDLRSLVQSLTKLPIFVVNTHADGDHTGCNHQFQEIWMHPAEFDYYAQKGNTCDNLHPLWEGDTLSLGKWNFEVLLIPGHTPGSIALLDREHEILISGDSVQTGTIYLFGPERNLPSYIASLYKLEQIRDSVREILPSHGQIPVSPNTISKLLEVAPKLLAGEYAGQPDPRGRPCQEYDCGVAKFLY